MDTCSPGPESIHVGFFTLPGGGSLMTAQNTTSSSTALTNRKLHVVRIVLDDQNASQSAHGVLAVLSSRSCTLGSEK